MNFNPPRPRHLLSLSYARVRSNGRLYYRSTLFQLSETRLHFLGKSSSRPPASLPVQNGDGHHEVLLPLRAGAVRLLVR